MFMCNECVINSLNCRISRLLAVRQKITYIAKKNSAFGETKLIFSEAISYDQTDYLSVIFGFGADQNYLLNINRTGNLLARFHAYTL
ncbi:hypothetical protein GCM10028805_01830 [Spirosoma harenae]